MKYLLIMQVCSSIAQTCTKPVELYPMHNSYYDCATVGYIRGLNVVRELGEEEVNKQKIVIKFGCQSMASI